MDQFVRLTGQLIGRYQVQGGCGRGGMGIVVRAWDTQVQRPVALKLLYSQLASDPAVVERFLREARTAAGLRHPNIVRVFDMGQAGGWYYIAMEFLEGETLADRLARAGPLPPAEAMAVLRQLSAALDYAHVQGLVHRDIKPGNIFLSPDGQVTLTDFGIARAASESGIAPGSVVVGTPAYMAPEQARGAAMDRRGDLYAVAVVAYEMLAGRPPFVAEVAEAVLHMHALEPPPPIRTLAPQLPVALEGVLARALAKDPAARYDSALELAAAIQEALGETAVEPAPIKAAAAAEGAAGAPAAAPVLPLAQPAAVSPAAGAGDPPAAAPTSSPAAPQPAAAPPEAAAEAVPPAARPGSGADVRWWLVGLGAVLLVLVLMLAILSPRGETKLDRLRRRNATMLAGTQQAFAATADMVDTLAAQGGETAAALVATVQAQQTAVAREATGAAWAAARAATATAASLTAAPQPAATPPLATPSP